MHALQAFARYACAIEHERESFSKLILSKPLRHNGA